MLAHESLAPSPIEHVVAADEAQVFEQLTGKERDDGAVVRRPRAVELDGVMNLRVEHRLEDDLARLLRRERLEGQLLDCRTPPGSSASRSLNSRWKRRVSLGSGMSRSSMFLSGFSVSTSTMSESCRAGAATHRHVLEA